MLLGVAVGAMFPLELLLIADTTEETTSLAGAAFFVAYVAAASAVGLGALRDRSASFGARWLALLACTAGIAVVPLLWRDNAQPSAQAGADTATGG